MRSLARWLAAGLACALPTTAHAVPGELLAQVEGAQPEVEPPADAPTQNPRTEPDKNSDDPAEAQQPNEPIDVESERALPDYDGRGDEPTTAGDVLIWIPRILLSPLYLVSEFVIRRPLGALVTVIEQEKVVPKVFDFFTFGPNNNIGIVPTGLIDFGFRPSVGIYFFWNDFIAEDNDLRLRAATWGPDWLLLNVKNRLSLNEDEDLTLRGEFLRRSDFAFHGIGPTSGDQRARYQATSIQGGLLYEADLWRSSRFESFVTARNVSVEADEGDDEPTLADEVARGRFPAPPGLDGYTVLEQGVVATFDSRPEREPDVLPEASDYVSPSGSGVRMQLRGKVATGLRDEERAQPDAPLRSQWAGYGASLGGFVDVGSQRLLGLTTVVDFVDPVAIGSTIPFRELASLGGERPLRGFLEQRLLGRSAVAAQLTYQWPIWVWLDGTLEYEVGNVFGPQLDGVELGLMRQSYGLGLRSVSSRDHVFEILLALGTETFDDGGQVENFRFVFGATSGF